MKFVLKNHKTFLILVVLMIAASSLGMIIFSKSRPWKIATVSEHNVVPPPRGEKAYEAPTPTTGLVAGVLDETTISAKSYLIAEPNSGEVVLEKNADETLPIASLTKMMTALLAYQYLDLQTPFSIKSDDLLKIQPYLGLRVGDKVQPSDLLLAMLTGSSNDAALALGNEVERQTGRDFETLMNEKAATLGMDNSNFSNRLGFDSAYNYSTAKDVLKLTRACLEILPCHMQERLTSYSFLTLEGRTLRTRASNELVAKHPEVLAVKTGYTQEAAGAMVVQWKANNGAYIIIVLGSQNRAQDILTLGSLLK